MAQENWPCAERWNLAASISQELGVPAAKGATTKTSHREAVVKIARRRTMQPDSSTPPDNQDLLLCFLGFECAYRLPHHAHFTGAFRRHACMAPVPGPTDHEVSSSRWNAPSEREKKQMAADERR